MYTIGKMGQMTKNVVLAETSDLYESGKISYQVSTGADMNGSYSNSQTFSTHSMRVPTSDSQYLVLKSGYLAITSAEDKWIKFTQGGVISVQVTPRRTTTNLSGNQTPQVSTYIDGTTVYIGIDYNGNYLAGLDIMVIYKAS